MRGIDIFVGGHAGSIKGEVAILDGLRMFSPVHTPPPGTPESAANTIAMIDSGAFSDPPERRLTPRGALERQWQWVEKARKKWGAPDWTPHYIVSYDHLIDEKWIDGKRRKERWGEGEAWAAVEDTLYAIQWMNRNRGELGGATPVMCLQGVTAQQYYSCLVQAEPYLDPQGDVVGLGGWCILGLKKSWLGEFKETIDLIMPEIGRLGIRHVHIFGVLWLPALSYLYHAAAQEGICVSTDSTAPVRACSGKNLKKGGARRPYWRDNVQWWKDRLQTISEYESDY